MNSELDENGIIGPFYFKDMDLVDDVREAVYSAEVLKDIHVNNASVLALLRDPALFEKLSFFSESNYKLWRTNGFYKSTTSSNEVAWHHDKHFQNGDESIDLRELGQHISVLIALDDVHEGNGAFEYVCGSHKDDLTLNRDLRPYHLKNTDEHFINVPMDAVSVNLLPMKKGQFALFHSALLHRTKPYLYGDKRVNLVARLCSQNVVIPDKLLRSKFDVINL